MTLRYPQMLVSAATYMSHREVTEGREVLCWISLQRAVQEDVLASWCHQQHVLEE